LGGDIDDGETIRRVREGDRNAYARLVDKFRDKMFGYCLRILGDESLAEDAAQEIFVKAYQALEKFREDSSFSTWLYRIAVNHCRDLLRRAKRSRTESWEELLGKDSGKFKAPIAQLYSEEINQERSEALQGMLALLSEEERSILVLREMNGFSYEELAQVNRTSVDSIKGKLKRIRKKIMKLKLKGEEPQGNL